MIKLLYLSYVDRKKLMVLSIFELLVMCFLVLIIYEKDAHYEMMLQESYYLTYIHDVFMQVFLIVNAMFVLFLVMDHDQAFLKPLMSYFGRFKVSLYKYIYLVIILLLYSGFLFMSYIVFLELLTPLDLDIDVIEIVYMFLDMMILMNFILISIRHKYKSLSIIILMIYIFQTLFNDTLPHSYQYVLPFFRLHKNYQILELYYKICYICLGFMIYIRKSMTYEP